MDDQNNLKRFVQAVALAEFGRCIEVMRGGRPTFFEDDSPAVRQFLEALRPKPETTSPEEVTK